MSFTPSSAAPTAGASQFLARARYQTVRAVALGFIWAAGLVFALTVAVYLLAPGGGLLALMAALVCLLVGAPLTLASARSRPLGVVAAPLAIGLSGTIAIAGLLLPELRYAVTPFLGFVVVLTSLASSRRLTVGVTVAATLLALAVLLAPPLSSLTLGGLAPVLEVVAPLISTLLIAVIAHSFTASQSGAVGLAERHAAAAEVARTQAEAALAQAEAQMAEQRRLLELVQSLELPALVVGQGVLAVPLVGSLDSRRIAAITARVLSSVAQHGAHMVIFDLTSVSAIDAAIARSLVDASQALRLLGARVLISGMRAGVAQTLSQLGLSLDGIEPVASLQQAMRAEPPSR